MVFDVMAMIMVGLVTRCLSDAAQIPCPRTTVAVNVTSAADVQNLTDVLSCTGEGDFIVTWYSSLAITETIVVSNEKNVTVTGINFPCIRGAVVDNNGVRAAVDAESGTGLFTASNGSTLRLKNLVLAGGNAEHGGAVNLHSSSSLDVFGCTFAYNNATNGGEMTCLPRAMFAVSNQYPAGTWRARTSASLLIRLSHVGKTKLRHANGVDLESKRLPP